MLRFYFVRFALNVCRISWDQPRGPLRKETRDSNTGVTMCKSCEFWMRHLASLSSNVFCTMGTWGPFPMPSSQQGMCPEFRAVPPDRGVHDSLVTSDDVTAPHAVQQAAGSSAVLSSHRPGHSHPALRWLVSPRPCSELLGHSPWFSCVGSFPEASSSLGVPELQAAP